MCYRQIYASAACIAFLGLANLAAFAEKVPTEEPSVTLQSRTTLLETLAAVHRASGGAVLAETPSVERKLDEELRAVPFPEALQRISGSFQYHRRRRRRSVAFLKRYVDPREISSLELDELKLASSDLYRLIDAVAPGSVDVSTIQNQIDFYRSLTSEQLAAMRRGSVPFSALKREQQALWIKINTTEAYGMSRLSADRLNAMFASWKQDFLAFETLKDGRTVLRFWFPDPENPKRLLWTGTGGGKASYNAGKVMGTGETLPDEPGRLTSGFKRKIQFGDGSTSVAALVAAIEKATERDRDPGICQKPPPAGLRVRCHGGGSSVRVGGSFWLETGLPGRKEIHPGAAPVSGSTESAGLRFQAADGASSGSAPPVAPPRRFRCTHRAKRESQSVDDPGNQPPEGCQLETCLCGRVRTGNTTASGVTPVRYHFV